jgi:isopentenyl diphosphate isomerase/L-lactate dehydrogenase-like FMN-dependent dehydrogenase
MLASPFTWDDIAWIRSRWSGHLLVKGVLSGDDAVLAAEAGADAVVVSNHGGRQLEGAPATIRVLPEVVAAAGDRLEVLLDGGVRRGGDVIKALATGARAVLVGRPYLYALAAAGEAGVERMLDIFSSEMSRTLSLLGCPGVSDLDRSWLQEP